jgi:hypothetical protein
MQQKELYDHAPKSQVIYKLQILSRLLNTELFKINHLFQNMSVK